MACAIEAPYISSPSKVASISYTPGSKLIFIEAKPFWVFNLNLFESVAFEIFYVIISSEITFSFASLKVIL